MKLFCAFAFKKKDPNDFRHGQQILWKQAKRTEDLQYPPPKKRKLKRFTSQISLHTEIP
jgi:hypothetical protein